MQDCHIAAPGGRIAEGPHLVFEVLVDREGKEFRFVAEAAQQLSGLSRVVADRVAFVRGRQPVIHSHRAGRTLYTDGRSRRSSSRASAASNWYQKSKVTRGPGARGPERMSSTSPSSVPAKSLARSRSTAAS